MTTQEQITNILDKYDTNSPTNSVDLIKDTYNKITDEVLSIENADESDISHFMINLNANLKTRLRLVDFNFEGLEAHFQSFKDFANIGEEIFTIMTNADKQVANIHEKYQELLKILVKSQDTYLYNINALNKLLLKQIELIIKY